jgi:hypothetical protein
MACLHQARKQESCCSFELNDENQKGKFWKIEKKLKISKNF